MSRTSTEANIAALLKELKRSEAVVAAAENWAKAMRRYDKMRSDNFEDAERIVQEMPDAWKRLCEAEDQLRAVVGMPPGE